MATVYLGCARGEGGAREVVALKVIRDEFRDNANFLKMFFDEAKILSRLNHPHIIRTLEYGIEGDHRFIAMELLSGRTLADLWDHSVAKERRFPLALGAWICARVADALDSAHELADEAGHLYGVIHRDVNPSNIFLTYDGEVKLIDFGLAKSRGREAESQDGIVKGKLPYLSPEQARGEPIDRRVDIFALGTTLWEIGTMRRLFKRADDVETLRAIQDPKIEDPRTLVRRYPETLARIVDRALKVSPDERYATAHDLGRDLDIFVRDASDQDMAVTLRAMLAEVYPGEREKHLAWIDRALPAPRATPPSTMPPPTPVPTASSHVLEVPSEDVIAVDSARSQRVLDDARRPSRGSISEAHLEPQPDFRAGPKRWAPIAIACVVAALVLAFFVAR